MLQSGRSMYRLTGSKDAMKSMAGAPASGQQLPLARGGFLAADLGTFGPQEFMHRMAGLMTSKCQARRPARSGYGTALNVIHVKEARLGLPERLQASRSWRTKSAGVASRRPLCGSSRLAETVRTWRTDVGGCRDRSTRVRCATDRYLTIATRQTDRGQRLRALVCRRWSAACKAPARRHARRRPLLLRRARVQQVGRVARLRFGIDLR
jgi:hypothetical protein